MFPNTSEVSQMVLAMRAILGPVYMEVGTPDIGEVICGGYPT